MSAATDRRDALFARTSTATLIASLRVVESALQGQDYAAPGAAENRTVRAWTIGELERRHPDAAAAVERAFDEWDAATEAGRDVPEVDYVAVLLAAIPDA